MLKLIRTIKGSHKEGIDAAKWGAGIDGGMSIIRNAVAVSQGEIKSKDAVITTVKETGAGFITSYSTGFGGAIIKRAMRNSKNTTARSLSKTNMPLALATAAFESGITFRKYLKGDIDRNVCLTELGEKGTSMVASVVFAKIGQVVIPIPVVGGMIGSTVGYTLSSSYYNELVNALHEAKFAYEERIRIEAECTKAIKAIREYRLEMEKLLSVYMIDHITAFQSAFNCIERAFKTNDVDNFILGANMITIKLGKKPKFCNFEEFNELMHSPDTIIL